MNPLLRMRLLTDGDIPLGMRLKNDAGWNQTEADWQRALALEPRGCFIAEWQGEPAGTITTCLFGPVAWVAMVLVEASLRGRGIGRALMEYALAFLEDQGVETIRLDATPLGQPLYEKLGFQAEYELARLEGTLPNSDRMPGVVDALEEDLEAILNLDRAVMATDRRKLLDPLFQAGSEPVRLIRGVEGLDGFLMARAGTRALHLGPCLASADAGPRLFTDACHRYAGRSVFIDIPLGNLPATRLAESWGLRAQRRLVRMSRGQPVRERGEALWASSGPEKG